MGGAQNGTGLVGVAVLGTGDAEVHDLHVAVGLDHDVLRLDVAMDDVHVVRDRKGLTNLRADFGDLALVDGTALLDGGFKVGAAYVFHDDVVRARVLTPVVHVHDVGARKVGSRRRFLAETRSELLVLGVLRQHHLNGDGTAQHVVLGAINLCHATDAYTLDDLIAVVQRPPD